MRNKSLDAVKAIAACLVVCIHVSFPGQAGQLVKVLARCAVPFFFMVSGYFCYYQNCNASKRSRCCTYRSRRNLSIWKRSERLQYPYCTKLPDS